MKNKITVKEAVSVLTDALRKDKELWDGYKANIAMAFKDEYKRQEQKTGMVKKDLIHTIANNAAENFLSLFTGI